MEHLNSETLARLVDEAPSDEERRHLEACPQCAKELRGYREQTEALTGLPDIRPPTGDWEVLQARLVSEGLLEGGGRLRSGLAHTPGWMKAAAAVLLFLTGMGAGVTAVANPFDGGLAGSGAGLPFLDGPAEFASVEEAAQAVRLRERQYVDALIQYRQIAGTVEGEAYPDPATRIATLDYVLRAGQAALRQAPADPFLNGLVASATAEREATIRQVSDGSGETWF